MICSVNQVITPNLKNKPNSKIKVTREICIFRSFNLEFPSFKFEVSFLSFEVSVQSFNVPWACLNRFDHKSGTSTVSTIEKYHLLPVHTVVQF